jgi:hypothetical protein
MQRQKERLQAESSPRQSVQQLNLRLRDLARELKDVQQALPRRSGEAVGDVIQTIRDTNQQISAVRRSIDELASQATIYRSLATLEPVSKLIVDRRCRVG